MLKMLPEQDFSWTVPAPTTVCTCPSPPPISEGTTLPPYVVVLIVLAMIAVLVVAAAGFAVELTRVIFELGTVPCMLAFALAHHLLSLARFPILTSYDNE